MDSIGAFEAFDLGSTPGTLAIFCVRGINMIEQQKQQNKSKQRVLMIPYTGVNADSGKWFVISNFMPQARCMIITHDDFLSIEIHAFQIFEYGNRRKGMGTQMMKMIRENFPNSFIWVDTWDHSRPFWQKMVDIGYVDQIGNDYSWPCFDSRCEVCHPNRNHGIRRGFKMSQIISQGGEQNE